ncbi:MAG: carbohydrate-binding domain-containing protein [Bacteroidaceae bacterium]|nr:carbohydrate-binding domain-containing protein [Bacteroidaceae bacterium]
MRNRFLIGVLWLLATIVTDAQTLNVEVGSVIYQIPADQAGEMIYENGQTVTILGKTYVLNDISQIVIDDTEVTDNTVSVSYNGSAVQVLVAGNIAKHLTVSVTGAHVSIIQDNAVSEEITYSLSGTSADGSFYMDGEYKATVELRGLTLTNPSGAAIDIQNGKRIEMSIKKDTENTLTDGTNGTQKAALYCKGHLELMGKGSLTINGNTAHAIKSGDYTTMKNCTVNILSAIKDGISCNEYFLMESGTLTISNTGDDAIQCDINGTTSTGMTEEHKDEDSGNFYLLGGTLTLTTATDAAKGIKAAGDVYISDGSLTVTQTGGIVVENEDISYPTSVKADGNITITGGTITITNTADGGKGLSAEGTLSIDESNAKTIIDIKANGKGGTAETSNSGSTEPAASYKVYISLPTQGSGGPGGGQSAWKNPVLYNSNGTRIASLTSTVTKSSGYSTLTFYYYDFKNADTSVSYYLQGDNYTSRNTTYTIKSATFNAPTSGTDIYYSINNSYTTSGTTRTYALSNVTNTYGGTSDISEENGTAYNAIGLKADGNLTISSGTITIANNGAMSKSIKSKKNVTVNGGDITLKPSGAMQVINSDASYSSGIKCDDFTLNDGSLSITASGNASRGISADNIITNGGTLNITGSGAGVQGSKDNYTSKGLKADKAIQLNSGTITITMSGTGGKSIKSAGTYTQGTSNGDGPTLKVTTSGASLGGSSQGGFPGQQSSGGSSAKGIKVQGTIYVYSGTSEIYTSTNGAEGMESKTAIYVEGGKHYFKCYDDCMNSSGAICFNGGVTVCYGYGNDAVDSNYGRTGAITIGNGVVFAYTTKGSPEEGLDCDNNSYIQITGTGIGISAGGSQGGGGWGGSDSGNTISGAVQGYNFVTSSISYQPNRYYTLADNSGNNLVTYSFEASCSSSLALFTATGMVKNGSYNVKSSTTAPTDATTVWHGLYLGSSAKGESSVTTFTGK